MEASDWRRVRRRRGPQQHGNKWICQTKRGKVKTKKIHQGNRRDRKNTRSKTRPHVSSPHVQLNSGWSTAAPQDPLESLKHLFLVYMCVYAQNVCMWVYMHVWRQAEILLLLFLRFFLFGTYLTNEYMFLCVGEPGTC